MQRTYYKAQVTDHLVTNYDFQDTDSYKGGTAVSEQIDRDNDISAVMTNGTLLLIPFKMRIKGVLSHEVKEIEIDDELCQPVTPDCPEPSGEIKFTGVNDVTINQGVGIDLREGVKAKYNGRNIDYDVSPSEIDLCDEGKHTVVYTATYNGITVTESRVVDICKSQDPVITAPDITVGVGEEFDPVDGASAIDGNGNSIKVEVIE